MNIIKLEVLKEMLEHRKEQLEEATKCGDKYAIRLLSQDVKELEELISERE